MTGPRFDFTINFGHVLTFGGLIITVIWGWAAFDTRISRVEDTLRTSTATLVEQVKQNTELRALSERVARLERLLDTPR